MARGDSSAAADAASGHAAERRILPRPLRFAMRHFSRTLETRTPMRAGQGSMLAIGFLAISVGYGLYQGGHTDYFVSSAASGAGLKVDAIKISGQIETDEIDVLSALGLTGHDALLGLDLRKARTNLLQLPWVAEVSIRKYFPGRIEIELSEKKPFAVWQRDKQFSVVEVSGKVIARFSDRSLSLRLAGLPRIVGAGAEKSAPQLLAMVSQFPSFASRVASYVRVADRRWNILLRNKIVIELPERGETSALAAVVDMDERRQLLSRAIETVDMRIDNRMVLRLEPAVADKRRISVKKRFKRMFKAEKSI